MFLLDFLPAEVISLLFFFLFVGLMAPKLTEIENYTVTNNPRVMAGNRKTVVLRNVF